MPLTLSFDACLLNGSVRLVGKNRQKVGQVAADMRSLREPDPYKNKGICYSDEKLKKKVGKTGTK